MKSPYALLLEAVARDKIRDRKLPKVKWIKDDGGKSAAGFVGESGDCVCRSIAIATKQPYRTVFDALSKPVRAYEKKWNEKKLAYAAKWNETHSTRYKPRAPSRRDASRGVVLPIYSRYLKKLGWKWTPLKRGRFTDLPKKGRLIVNQPRHLVAVINGVVHDTHNCFKIERTYCIAGRDQRGQAIIRSGTTRRTTVKGYWSRSSAKRAPA